MSKVTPSSQELFIASHVNGLLIDIGRNPNPVMASFLRQYDEQYTLACMARMTMRVGQAYKDVPFEPYSELGRYSERFKDVPIENTIDYFHDCTDAEAEIVDNLTDFRKAVIFVDSDGAPILIRERVRFDDIAGLTFPSDMVPELMLAQIVRRKGAKKYNTKKRGVTIIKSGNSKLRVSRPSLFAMPDKYRKMYLAEDAEYCPTGADLRRIRHTPSSKILDFMYQLVDDADI